MASSQNVIPKSIPEQKLKAFSIGTMGKRTLSKRELEELRKKEQEEAAAHAFQEFVETFQEPTGTGAKIWVKGGTYDAGQCKEDTKDRGKLYKPQSRISAQENMSSAERAQEYARLLAADRKPERLGKKVQKHKSNLESFKEELRQIQEEREERHKYKVGVKSLDNDLELVKPCEIGSYDNGDPTTTNLYLGNLNPKITEQELMEIFGKFGPLASIKIMWPRSDEEKARGRNCGFVAFMNRKDGERALKHLNGKDVMSYEMKLGWGRSVIIPSHPIYVPPALLELSLPPRPSGLPFNAQPYAKDTPLPPQNNEELEKVLYNSVVKVVIPTDRNLLMLINRMVEFVIREGPLFEAMIMNREINSPLFRFLFENQSPAHIYYRWKLYSIMQGDLQKEWRMNKFRMFKGGSVWKPPIMNVYTQGMPADLIEDETKEPSKGSLSNTQRDRLEDLIRNLSPERKKIGEAMVFCIEHSEAADEITECIFQSLSNNATAVYKKIARFYLISDILHNCGVKINNASYYRRSFEQCLIDIMKQLSSCYNNLTGRLKAEGFKLRVFKVLKAWEDAVIYTRDFLNKLHNAFLGLDETNVDCDSENDPRIEGIPIDDEDLDCPMDGATLLKGILKNEESNSKCSREIHKLYSQDGLASSRLIYSNTENVRDKSRDKINENSPTSLISQDLDGVPISNEFLEQISEKTNTPGFIPSKWETVDPDQVFAQAMTTSKWDQLENSVNDDQSISSPTQNDMQDTNETENSRNLTEERRIKLREIELKILQYQDELESGVKTLKTGWTVAQQVEHYRRKLLRKSEKEKSKQKELKNLDRNKKDWSERSTWRSSSPEDYYKDQPPSRRGKKRSRSSSDSSPDQREHDRDRTRTRSKSPVLRKRHHSRSPSRKTSKAPSPPTPPRIKRCSPTSSKYSPSSKNKSRSGRYKLESMSPGRYSSKYGRGRSSSPNSSGRYSTQSPEVQKKHRHKHKY